MGEGQGAGGTPSSLGQGGYPGVLPHLDLGWGTPPTWDGVPPISWMGYPLTGPGMGYPPAWAWDGVPPMSWMGYPPPPGPGTGVPPWSAVNNVNRQTPVKTVPSLVLRTRAVMI